MASPLWLLTWWGVFGDGRRLRVWTFWRGDELVGVAPLCLRRHWYPPGIPYRRLELLGSGEDEADEICSDYLGVVAAPGDTHILESVGHAGLLVDRRVADRVISHLADDRRATAARAA